MGRVSDHVLGLVRRQLEEGGPVVWFDADNTYENIVEQMGEEVPVFRYTDSFLRLRREVDQYMNDIEPPKIIIYVPLDEQDTHDALVEFTAAGATLRPGHTSYPCNTRLSVVARAALSGAVPDSSLVDIIAKVDAGQFTLENLDHIAEQGAPDISGLSLVYESIQPDEITLSFLSDDAKDQDLETKGAIADLKRLASEEFGVDLAAIEDIAVIRTRLAGYILTADCLLSMTNAPEAVDGITAPGGSAQRSAVRRVAEIWRNRRDFEDSYLRHSREIEETINLDSLPNNLADLRDTQTFSTIDVALQKLLATSMHESPTDSLLQTAKQRQRTFWGRQPASNKRWQLIAAAGDLLIEAESVQRDLGIASTVSEMVERYTETGHPWCEFDTAQRRLERLYLEFEDIASHSEIEMLVSKARQTYQDIANRLSEAFIGALYKANFRFDGLNQRHVFHDFVNPKIKEGRIAYFLVDAMRYEMGRELWRALSSEGEANISGAIASVPTITEIGMASLLPEAEKGVEIVDAGAGKLALKVGEEVLGNRRQRMDFLQKHAGVPTAILRLEDLLPFQQATRKKVSEAHLIVVTSQEIDMVGEADNSIFARQTMGGVIDLLVKAVHALTQVGVEQFVLTADHGHLFGEETRADMLLDRPTGGNQADLHRRCWIGHGGAIVPNTVRFKTTDFGLGGDLEIVTPTTLACFKAGGSNSFFHGGLSLQELIIPVVAVTAQVKGTPSPDIKWKMSGPKRVTTRVYSLSIGAEAVGLFPIEPPLVRVELLVGKKDIGQLQDADYGVVPDTTNIQLRASSDGRSIEDNHITFLLEGVEAASELEVHLVDARTNRLLDTMEHVEVAISL